MFEEHLGAADNAYPRRRGRGVHVNLVQSDATLYLSWFEQGCSSGSADGDAAAC